VRGYADNSGEHRTSRHGSHALIDNVALTK